MIFRNAKDIPLNTNPGTLPNVSAALTQWQQPMKIYKIVKTIVNFKVVETPTVINFSGVVQAGTPEQLIQKPEGQRSWRWSSIWILPGVDVSVDDIIESLGKKYRVMSKTDWVQYGYVALEVSEDWT